MGGGALFAFLTPRYIALHELRRRLVPSIAAMIAANRVKRKLMAVPAEIETIIPPERKRR